MVLSGFNIKAEQGKSIALCGISGSGKSTTIALLEHYYDILCGNIVKRNV
jgi:ATP-binding cassette subfamily B (MDR/TAP) protein 1